MENSRVSAVHQTFAVLAAFAMLIAWLIPFHDAPWSSFYNELCMATALALLLLALVLIRGIGALPLLSWCLVALSAIPWVQWSLGLVAYAGDAWVATLYLWGFALAVASGFQWPHQSKINLPVLIACATVTAACVSSMIGLDQSLNGGDGGVWTLLAPVGAPAQGNLGQANNLATLIALGAIGLLLLREKQLLNSVVSLTVLLLMLLGVGFTQSRTALLYGPIIVIGVAIFSKRNPGVLKTRVATLCIATAIHWLIAFTVPLLNKSMQLQESTAMLASRGLESSRYQVWQMFFAALKESPWAGYGWLETITAQFVVADRFPPVGEMYYQAHNLFIELLVWCGYPLGLLLCATVIYWFFSRAKAILNGRSASQLVPLCALLSVGVFGVHSMLELPYHYAYFLIPIGLWMGVIERSLGSRGLGSANWNWAVTLSAVILVMALSRDYFVVQRDFNSARGEFTRGVFNPQAPVDAPTVSAVAAYSNSLRTQAALNMSDTDLARMRQIVARFPYHFGLLNFSAALAMNGRMAEATEILLKLRSIHGVQKFETAKAYLRALRDQQSDPGVRKALDTLASTTTD